VINLLCSLVGLYVVLIIGRVILSWFPANPYGPMGQVVRIVMMLTDPVLVPVRRALPLAGSLDLSPLVVLLFLQIVVQGILLRC
jgi:YggT family protein